MAQDEASAAPRIDPAKPDPPPFEVVNENAPSRAVGSLFLTREIGIRLDELIVG